MPKILSFDIINSIIDLYKSGKSSMSIGKELGISQKTILAYLKKSNVEIRSRINNVDENYFSSIDTQEKAYLLGYLFADSCVRYNTTKRYYGVRLKIHEKDIHILEFMKKEMNCDNSVFKKESGTNCISLTISSKKIAEDLIKLGCTPKKSLTLKFPKINNEYINSFILGYFDGDGSIYLYKNQIHFKLLGTLSFLSSISKYFESYGVLYKVEKYPSSNIYQYRVFSKKSIEKIYNILYKNTCNTFLERKKIIFDKILKNNNINA